MSERKHIASRNFGSGCLSGGHQDLFPVLYQDFTTRLHFGFFRYQREKPLRSLPGENEKQRSYSNFFIFFCSIRSNVFCQPYDLRTILEHLAGKQTGQNPQTFPEQIRKTSVEFSGTIPGICSGTFRKQIRMFSVLAT